MTTDGYWERREAQQKTWDDWAKFMGCVHAVFLAIMATAYMAAAFAFDRIVKDYRQAGAPECQTHDSPR